MSLYLIVNPNAGKKQGIAVAKSAVGLFHAHNVPVEIAFSTCPGHTTELAAGLAYEKWDGLIAVGGDGTVLRRNLIFIEICNSRFTGGNMIMAPSADIADGLLDVILVNDITRRRLLKLFPRIFRGTHVDDESVAVISGTRIHFESDVPLALTPDGETFGSTPVDVEIIPSAVRMFG